jgi:predicted ATP-grasp superfamily ATP-dependent carboligase
MAGAPPSPSRSAAQDRALRRIREAAPHWRRPAAVITNLENFVGLQTARILHRHGIPVVALADRPRDPLCRTRCVEAILDAGPAGSETVRVLEEIAPLFPARPVLLPCSDAAVFAVSAARQSLDYHVMLPEHEIIEMLTDKSRFLQRAERAGVSVSPYRLLHNRGDAEAASSELAYPVVMKPFRSNPAWGARVGQKALRVFDASRMLEVWDRAKPDYPVLAQEWVEGGDDRLFSCNAYFDAEGTPLVTFVARKLRQWPPHTGMSSLGVECRNDAVLEAALTLFGSVPYRGLAYLEVKQDVRNGRHFAIEANIGRPTGRSAIAEAGGVELIYTAYCDALGLPLPTARVQHYGGAKWIYFARDFASAWYYHRRGKLTLREWRRSIRGVRMDAVFSRTDPVPFILDSLSGLVRVLRREPLD